MLMLLLTTKFKESAYFNINYNKNAKDICTIFCWQWSYCSQIYQAWFQNKQYKKKCISDLNLLPTDEAF